MPSSLLIIDSREREDFDNTDPTNIRILLENSIKIKKISLVYIDLPVDGNDTESNYYLTIQELGEKGLRRTRYRDTASFIHIKGAPQGFRSIAHENQTFSQSIELHKERNFTEFNIQLRYRANTSTPLVINNDYTVIFKIESN